MSSSREGLYQPGFEEHSSWVSPLSKTSGALLEQPRAAESEVHQSHFRWQQCAYCAAIYKVIGLWRTKGEYARSPACPFPSLWLPEPAKVSRRFRTSLER